MDGLRRFRKKNPVLFVLALLVVLIVVIALAIATIVFSVFVMYTIFWFMRRGVQRTRAGKFIISQKLDITYNGSMGKLIQRTEDWREVLSKMEYTDADIKDISKENLPQIDTLEEFEKISIGKEYFKIYLQSLQYFVNKGRAKIKEFTKYTKISNIITDKNLTAQNVKFMAVYHLNLSILNAYTYLDNSTKATLQISTKIIKTLFGIFPLMILNIYNKSPYIPKYYDKKTMMENVEKYKDMVLNAENNKRIMKLMTKQDTKSKNVEIWKPIFLLYPKFNEQWAAVQLILPEQKKLEGKGGIKRKKRKIKKRRKI